MKPKETSPASRLSLLSSETAPSKIPTSSLSPYERANLHRRLEVLNFELKRLEASLIGATDHRCTYWALAGDGLLVYHLPVNFMVVAEHLHGEARDVLLSQEGDALAASVTVRMPESLLETGLAPENAEFRSRTSEYSKGLGLASVEVPIMRITDLGNL